MRGGIVCFLITSYGVRVAALNLNARNPRQHRDLARPTVDNVAVSRRRVIEKTVASVGATMIGAGVPDAAVAASSSTGSSNNPSYCETNNGGGGGGVKDKYHVYHVIPDSSTRLDPKLVPINNSNFLSDLVESIGCDGGGAVWLGEHHDSFSDHFLQAQLLRELSTRRHQQAVAVGLEQVQQQYQPVLDAYSAGTLSLEQLQRDVDWEKSWSWPFERYQPIFETCQYLKIPLVALNVDTKDLTAVEKSGYPGLAESGRLAHYITDPVGFGEFANQESFRTYVDYVIRPSYEVHQQMGLLRYTSAGEKLSEETPFRNFLSSRILWDEGMARTAHNWCTANPGGLLVGMVGAGHVKFRQGIPGRFDNMVHRNRKGEDKNGAAGSLACTSIMLNPTLIDTQSSATVVSAPEAMAGNNPDQITLQLRYLKDDVDPAKSPRLLDAPAATGGVLPLADYLVFATKTA